MVAIIAPRREPADMIVRHIASQTSINDNGPEASAATPLTSAPFGTNGREIIPDAAALLHGQRGLFQHVKNPAHAVGNCAHDKAVEQSHLTRGAGPSSDPACGQVFEICQRVVELRFPVGGSVFDAAKSTRDARQLSSTVLSMGVPSASLKRYFISQICSAIGAAKRVMYRSIYKRKEKV